jgi:N-acetylneuraminic acid mutarotase
MIYLFIILFFVNPGFSEIYEGQWETLAEMNVPRYNFSVCVHQGKIYAIGGTIGGGMGAPATASVEVYDPEEDKWNQETELSSNRTHAAACIYNDEIYVLGGSSTESVNPQKIVEVYDLKSKNWTRKEDMLTKKMNSVAITYNNKIYTVGGQANNGLKNLEEYDPESGEWSRKADMIVKRALLFACVVNEKFYAFGGGSYAGLSKKVEKYDPVANVWAEHTQMSLAKRSMGGCVIGDSVIIVGGTTSNNLCSDVELYNTNDDTWHNLPCLPSNRVALCAASIGNKIYAIGGSKRGWPYKPLGTTEVLDLSKVTAINSGDKQPATFNLHQNYPNPFNSSTTIEFKMPEAANVKISIYDINGKLIEELINEPRSAGSNFVTWNPVNIPSGIYFYRVKAGDYSAVKKCILMK